MGYCVMFPYPAKCNRDNIPKVHNIVFGGWQYDMLVCNIQCCWELRKKQYVKYCRSRTMCQSNGR